jgi:hypothetical protein
MINDAVSMRKRQIAQDLARKRFDAGTSSLNPTTVPSQTQPQVPTQPTTTQKPLVPAQNNVATNPVVNTPKSGMTLPSPNEPAVKDLLATRAKLKRTIGV